MWSSPQHEAALSQADKEAAAATAAHALAVKAVGPMPAATAVAPAAETAAQKDIGVTAEAPASAETSATTASPAPSKPRRKTGIDGTARA
eukprot:SAG25_NODE_676_length_5980_cov_37.613671_4_plen_90_part_00